jgi:membrane associated rhomboid family serine protease
VRASARGWVGFCALLGLAALIGQGIEPEHLDWQPRLAPAEPWRAFTAIAVHYGRLHLAANLAGTVLVAALGVAAAVPRRSTWAWIVAWPLVQLGLLARPDLLHYGGLSGLLHAGVAVVGVHLVMAHAGVRRTIGLVLLAGLLAKAATESPWGPALRHAAGWDIATAPFAHVSGIFFGMLCSALVEWRERRLARRRASRPTIT